MNDNIAEARNNFMNRTFGLVGATESLDEIKLIFRIREIFLDEFGKADKNELAKINATLKNIAKVPNISQPQIPNS